MAKFDAFKQAASRSWLHFTIVWRVILSRAWIGPLGLAVAAVALLYFGQSRDLLLGLRDTILFANQNLLEPAFRWNGVIAYASFWLSATVLATVLALAVRITGIEGSATVRQETPDTDTANAVARCALVVPVATLFVIHFAFLWQSAGGINDPVRRFLLLFSILIVPWMVLRVWRWDAGTKQYLTAGALTAVFLAGVWLYVKYHSWAGEQAQNLSAATPYLAILALAGISSRKSLSESTWVLVLLIATLLLSVCVLWPWPSTVFWTVGSVPIVLLWLAWAICVVTCVVLVLRLLRKTVAGELVSCLLLAGLLLSLPPGEFGRESLEPASLATSQSLQTTDDEGIDPPQEGVSADTPNGVQFAIHADGGGLRAALFTADVLATADDITCGDFGAHLLAASGVSGGSLGIATWAVMRQELVQSAAINKQESWSECKARRTVLGLAADASVDEPDLATPLRNRVYGVLAQDHLSATLAAMLAHDFVWPWGSPARGQALLDSWQVAAQDVMLSYGDSYPEQRRAFAIALKDIDAGLGRRPLLMFTATDTVSGERVVFSNSKLVAPGDLGDLSIGLAALNSARFPLISPAGLVRVGDSSISVVDGGYFDNSGAATLGEALGKAKGEERFEKATVVRIEGNALSSDNPGCDKFFQTLATNGYYPAGFEMPEQWASKPPQEPEGWSDLDAAMAARSALANEIAKTLDRLPFVASTRVPLQLDYYAGFDPQCAEKLPPGGHPKDLDKYPCATANISICFGGLGPRAPLGWYMSTSAATNIDRSAWNAARQLAEHMRPPPTGNGPE